MPVRERGQGEPTPGQHVPFSGHVQAHTPGERRAFAPAATEDTGERDSPLEGRGFEPSVPQDKRRFQDSPFRLCGTSRSAGERRVSRKRSAVQIPHPAYLTWPTPMMCVVSSRREQDRGAVAFSIGGRRGRARGQSGYRQEGPGSWRGSVHKQSTPDLPPGLEETGNQARFRGL